jgi:hypothetical protein
VAAGNASATFPIRGLQGHRPSVRRERTEAEAGAKHVSFEYLKIGTEEKRQTVNRISAATGRNVWDVMVQRGITRICRDYKLASSAKCDFIRTAKQLCRASGVKFGAGDTEFIHLSDGLGCCK